MSFGSKTVAADTEQSGTPLTIPPWTLVAALAVAAIGVSIYRLVAVGPSLLNWAALVLSCVCGLSFAAAVIYFERIAPAKIDRLSSELDGFAKRLRDLEEEVEDLADDLPVSDDECSNDHHQHA
jgi:hypothetical protein